MLDEVKVCGVGFWNTPGSDMRKFVAYLRKRSYDIAITQNVVYIFSDRNFNECVDELYRLSDLVDRTLGTEASDSIPEAWTLHECCRSPTFLCETGHPEYASGRWQH